MSSDRSKEALERELLALKEDYRLLRESGSFRLGRILVEAVHSPVNFFRLPWDIFNLIRSLKLYKKKPALGSSQYECVKEQLRTLLNNIKNQKASQFVVLFSGTTYIQGTRGNRPIRQTLALLDLEVPVFFSYHRTRFTDDLPGRYSDRLVQSPVDISMQLLEDISRQCSGNTSKLFIISYPFKGVEKYVSNFRSRGWRILYDCRDDWQEFAKVGMANWYDFTVEKFLLKNVHKTFCVSGPLVKKMRNIVPGAEVALMPNAVDRKILRTNFPRNPTTEPRTIGYFGHLSAAWFDWQALIEIAKRCSHLRFEIIGHSAPAGIKAPENVQLLGPIPWQDLHCYAAKWSAAIIPFRMGPLADAVDPIKIYEYLAFGLPVISFSMPQIESYPFTTTVTTTDEFCQNLDKVSRIEVDQNIINDFLHNNTWDLRAKMLLEELKVAKE